MGNPLFPAGNSRIKTKFQTLHMHPSPAGIPHVFPSCGAAVWVRVPKLNPQIIGPRYTKLRDWHHGVSARTLNVQ
ncbi:hypothetical protein JZ751_001681 [Albula glossodonta]|uniref:Uncharacterized protein n=1 Tax=Albula glossodonta TaxID=121402 RepID=A0A8T2PUL7_9TELE|nr:hypothetical protein JZ751_001681 [Albula glossodonta]